LETEAPGKLSLALPLAGGAALSLVWKADRNGILCLELDVRLPYEGGIRRNQNDQGEMTMLLEAVYHRPKLNWAYAYDRETVHLRLRTKRGDVDRVQAAAGDKYGWEQTVTDIELRLFASDAMFDYWEAAVTPAFRRLRYAFKLYSGGRTLYRTEAGFFEELPDNPPALFEFPYLNPADVFEPPAWVKDAVFYQIFPERFANGDPSLNPEGTLPWGGEPTEESFFGGDLQGVMDRLDHLTELGVNAIYFTPVFEAETNHKYDTQDYMRVDRRFGTNAKLKELVDLCHARGIRVLLDAVFNHCGQSFAPFADVLENGERSRYAGWFHRRPWPSGSGGLSPYETYAFEPLMPKLNTAHPEVKKYLLEVARYWIEEIGIDGWRLDVANEVDHRFWREFRLTVKEAKPDAYILGEIWHDSMMWLQGDQFDAVMNYPFSSAVLEFFAQEDIGAGEFADAIGRQLAAYPRQATEAAFNLLGSHDTPRLLTICGGSVPKMKLAALFLLAYPGAPCIYYGDEVGLDGGGDPGCRKCMEWDADRQNADLLAFYKAAIALRRSSPALRSAGLRFLLAEPGEGALAYERKGGGQRLLIAMNARGGTASLRFGSAPQHGSDAAQPLSFRGFGEEGEAAASSPSPGQAVRPEAASPALPAAPSGIDSAGRSPAWRTLLSNFEERGSIRTENGGGLAVELPPYGFVVLEAAEAN